MPDERRQFRILYRDFLLRIVDLDVLADSGDIRNLMGQIAALLAAFNFCVAIVFIPRYTFTYVPPQQLATAAWNDEQFLVSTTMAISGLFAVLAWNAVFPDRRDSVVLGLLPVRTRTIFLAKAAAIATALGVSTAAANLFTGVGYPLIVTAPGGDLLGSLRSFAAYWITMAAASLFVCCALLAVQGVASQLLSYRLFLRASNVLQLAAFFLILGIYFLEPALANPKALTAPENQRYLAVLPQYWFLGIFHELNGGANPVFAPLAIRALWSLLIAGLIAGVSYTLAYQRNIRRIIEQPDIAPGDRSRPAARVGRFAAAMLFRAPLDRAILLFTARTMSRSRQHRLLLAAYGGIGLAIALAYAKSLLYGYSRDTWNHVNLPFLIGGVVLLFFAVVGARAVFALPLALPANWIFRMTLVHTPAAYFAAVRKSLFAVASAPVWLAAAAIYFGIWPGRSVLEHLTVLLLAGVLLVQCSLYQFRKIPFACSYLPGKSNMKVKVGAFGALFFAAAEAVAHLELWAMERFARFCFLAALLFCAALWTRRRTAEYAGAPSNRVQFEDAPAVYISVLDLRRDGSWSNDDAYVGAIENPKTRVKHLAMAAGVLLVCGTIFEQIAKRMDERRFAPVGQSVSIGGRALNIYCSGEGGPAVIFDSGHGAPGYAWLPAQREVAQFARACWYDRAGLGWSDPGPRVNTSDAAARDLHALLQAAHIPPPYLLVGASRGGFNVRVFHGYYPGEVSGMVLVDASHEDIRARIPDEPRRVPPADLSRRFLVHFVDAVGQTGLFRVFMSMPGPPASGFTPREWETLFYLNSRPKAIAAQVNEGAEKDSAVFARASGGFGDMPLIVLTAGRGMRRTQQIAWIQLQSELAEQSTRGKQYVLEKSGHMIQQEAPDAVVAAVRELVNELR